MRCREKGRYNAKPWTGYSGCVPAQRHQRPSIAFKHIAGLSEVQMRNWPPKRIKIDVGLKHVDGSCRLSCQHEPKPKLVVIVITIESESAIKFCKCFVLAPPEQQSQAELKMTDRQIGVEQHCLPGQFVRLIDSGGAEIVLVYRVPKGAHPRARQPRVRMRVIGVARLVRISR